MRQNHSHAPNWLNRGILNDAWESHHASRFVARWYANVLQLHTRLEVELDHEWGGAKSRAGCPPSESSGAKVHVQPTVTAIFNRFTRWIARYRVTRLCGQSAVYHRKLGPRTIRLNLVMNRLLTSWPNAFNNIANNYIVRNGKGLRYYCYLWSHSYHLVNYYLWCKYFSLVLFYF